MTARPVIVVVIIVVVTVVAGVTRRGFGRRSQREQLLELTPIEPDAATAVAAIDGDAVAVKLGEGGVAAGTVHGDLRSSV
jgi:hypothetical protein